MKYELVMIFFPKPPEKKMRTTPPLSDRLMSVYVYV